MASAPSPLYYSSSSSKNVEGLEFSFIAFPHFFLLFMGLLVLYFVVRCKGDCIANNGSVHQDIETEERAAEQQPYSNRFMQFLHNSQQRYFHHHSQVEANRVHEDSNSKLILQLLQSFQQRAPASSYTSALPSECAICLEVLEQGKQSWILPRCKHVFHDVCIREWLKSSGSTCPICRRVICFL